MVGLELEIEATDKIAEALSTLEDVTVFFHPHMEGWVDQTLMERLWGMKNYAPPRPGSDYVRTGDFGSRWEFDDVGWSAFEFWNDHEAAALIVGDDQAWMHHGRWWQAVDRIDERVDRLMQVLEEVLSKWPNR